MGGKTRGCGGIAGSKGNKGLFYGFRAMRISREKQKNLDFSDLPSMSLRVSKVLLSRELRGTGDSKYEGCDELKYWHDDKGYCVLPTMYWP